MRLEGLVSSVDGKELIRDSVEGSIEDPESIGLQLAERLLARARELASARDDDEAEYTSLCIGHFNAACCSLRLDPHKCCW